MNGTRRILGGVTLGLTLTLSGCARTMEPPEFTRVMGVLAPSFRLGLETNPTIERIGDRTLRITAATTHQCEMNRSDTTVEVDGSTATVQLWELRGPCDPNEQTPELGIHKVEVEFVSGGEVELVLWNLIPGFGIYARDVYTIDLDEPVADAGYVDVSIF